MSFILPCGHEFTFNIVKYIPKHINVLLMKGVIVQSGIPIAVKLMYNTMGPVNEVIEEYIILGSLFNPSSIAVIGASPVEGKVGNAWVKG